MLSQAQKRLFDACVRELLRKFTAFDIYQSNKLQKLLLMILKLSGFVLYVTNKSRVVCFTLPVSVVQYIPSLWVEKKTFSSV
jgi:hypothetical protein